MLSYHEQETIMNRFPKFELSYEKNSHTKVSNNYTLAMAIPRGKKYYAWFSFYMEHDICFMMELNKERKIINVKRANIKFNIELAWGTILYGSVIVDDHNTDKWYFVVEDICYFRGNPITNQTFHKKLVLIQQILEKITSRKHIKPANENEISMVCKLPIMWNTLGGGEAADTIPSSQTSRIKYPVHHIKYIEPYRISPYCNVVVKKFGNGNNDLQDGGEESSLKLAFKKTHLPVPVLSSPLKFNYYDRIYKSQVVFKIIADMQYDIYHLYAKGADHHQYIYTGVAGVPTYKTSVYLNSLFRKIRENTNIDYIEESDDEEEFQKTDLNKYVDLNKEIEMVCRFDFKNKKWVPFQVSSENTQIVEFASLCPIENNEEKTPHKYVNSNNKTHNNQKYNKNNYNKYSRINKI